MIQKTARVPHECPCAECSECPTGKTATLHQSINLIAARFDEKSRRRFVGLLAQQHGYGGIRYFAMVTGLSHTTILLGQREIQEADTERDGRIRKSGGGRKLFEKKMHR